MPFEQPNDRATANFGQYNDVAGHQTNNHNTLNNRISGVLLLLIIVHTVLTFDISIRSAGDGGSGGRGGDVNHTTYNFFTSRPFDGSLNQMWTLEDRQNGKFAIVSVDKAQYLSAKGEDVGLRLSQTAQLWRVIPDGSAFKIVSPESGLALTLGRDGGLSPLSAKGDVNQSLYILESTPENQERIKSGRFAQGPPASRLLQGDNKISAQTEAKAGENLQAPNKQTARRTEVPTPNQTPIDIPGAAGLAGMNVTINYYGGSPSDTNVLEELRKFLALDGARNLVVFLGQPLLSTAPFASPSTADPAFTNARDSASRTCGPSTPSSRHTCPTIAQTKLQISSGDSCYVTADSSDITSKVWFKTQALDADWLESVTSLQLFTVSRDQGWAALDEDASWTWFEIVILDDPTNYQPKTMQGRGPLRWPGNAIAACVCAQHPGWQNHAEVGHLHFEMFE
ncbi:hypothetical protein NLJ89_g3675 [Agrocybe chaxingu]|uniref:Ricin B lectin domain-containing protein n=1 Tax=Agrocybe chaxingu TaxID=84603 RepID=A0A9W8MWN1_9AGAR|nr:hypothetical protein NLJ89_g3675 [Agrocybe chaxingu]